MSEIKNDGTKSTETKPLEAKSKKVVGRNLVIGLGIVVVLLIAGLGGAMVYYNMQINNKDTTINQLNATLANQNKMMNFLDGNITTLTNDLYQTQIWLAGNETLLSETQANNTNLQDQIGSLYSNITNLQNQVDDLNALNATFNLAKYESTSWGDYPLDSGPSDWKASGIIASYAGFVSFVASSSSAFNVSVELSYDSNGTSYDRTAYVGSESFSSNSHVYEDSTWFPILPSSSGVEVTVTNLSPYAYVNTTSVTYFY